MKRIMFVDDEPNVLSGIKRMLWNRRKQWRMEFIESGALALERLAQEQFHVLITDMRMPVMDGATLLEKVRELSPSTVRIVLSGHSGENNILRTVRPAHQYLAKPVDKEALENVIEKALTLTGVLAHPALAGLLAKVEVLPATPQVFGQLLAEMESGNCSLDKVGELIGCDMGMTVTILKLVNSAFFRLPHKVATATQAVSLLGVETIKSLVLSYQLFTSSYLNLLEPFSMARLWSHSLNTGALAKAIAQCENWDQDRVDEAFLAGMMHDVGKLTLMTVAGEHYGRVVDRVRQGEGLLHEIESIELGATHGEAGAYLLGLWGFDSSVIQAIGLHHCLRRSIGESIDLLTMIHVADGLEHEMVVINPDYRKPELDMEYLEKVGAAERVQVWTQACHELIKRRGDHADNGVA